MKFNDIFSGMGGFRHSLESVGMECTSATEKDEVVAEMYKVLHGEENIHGDIKELTGEQLEDFDLLVGGPPCQNFSTNGNRKGFDGITGSLFFEAIRIALEKQPKFILLENVTGLLNHNEGMTISIVLESLNKAGYTVDINIMKSVEFGVPQKRERVFIVGVLNHPHEDWTFDNKTKAVNKVKKTILENYPDLKTFKHEYPVGNKTAVFKDIAEDVKNPVYLDLGDFLQQLPNGEWRIKDGTVRGYTDFTAIPLHTTIDYTFMTSKTRRGRIKQGITKTLDQSVDIAVFDGVGWRRITPLEVFRLQGFPDEFYYKLKEAGFKEKELYARPSRSITVPVVKALGESILKLENKLYGGV